MSVKNLNTKYQNLIIFFAFATSAKEVVSTLFLAGLHKRTNQAIFTQFGGNVVHRPRKNPLDVGGNPDAITLGLGLGWVMVTVDVPHYPQQDCVTVR